MNTYYKFAPHVFLAKCEEKHKKGDLILVTNRHGKENESIIHNLIFELNDCFYYSITRADGTNTQTVAKSRAERRQSWALSAAQKSNEYYERSNKDRDFLSLGEPIKIGHHSEKRHRKIIKQAQDNADRCIDFSKKADDHLSVASYWQAKENEINLSMPESIEFYEKLLDQAIEYHNGLKSGIYEKKHSYSMKYANDKRKELTKKLETAKRLWQ